MIDNLSYNYNGNSSLLSSVSDASNNLRGFKGAASSYGYDPTGNMISDSQKGITDIAYTYNDLPIKITSANGTIENFYTSAGEKLKSIITPTNQEINAGPVTRVYLGGAEYVDGELEAVYTNEGRVVISKDGNYPEYYLKDHLGNTRVRIADKNLDHLVFIDPNDPENDELMSTHHYYPFGMEWDTPALDVSGNDLGQTGVDSRYTYNGKEHISDLDINLSDYGARYYDPAVARWTSVDPMTENYSSFSSYNYTLNNPIRFIDPNGMYVSANASYNAIGAAFDNQEEKEEEEESQANWNGLRKVDLKYYAIKSGYCFDCSENDLGSYFEDIFESYMLSNKTMGALGHGFMKNIEKWTDSGKRNTVPDFTSISYFGEWIFPLSVKTTPVYGGGIYEVKQKNGGVYLSTSSGQIKGHINNLVSRHSSMMKRGFIPSFTVVTTSDVSYSRKSSSYASKLKVNYTHVYAEFNVTSSGQWDFRFKKR